MRFMLKSKRGLTLNKKEKTATPHLISGTDVLKNKGNFTNKKDLMEFESEVYLNRFDSTPEGNFSSKHLKKIHEHILKDVYDWAGKYRDVPTARNNSRFCQPQFISAETDRITNLTDISKFKKMDKKDFVKNLAHSVGELNAIHPFLDGNGRTIRIYAKKICKEVGYNLDIKKLKGDEWNKASAHAFSVDNKKLESILNKSLSPLKEKKVSRVEQLKQKRSKETELGR